MPAERIHSVLVVEDERIIAKDLQQTLAGMGYDAYAIAPSAEEALTRASTKRPDVVLMDIRIKGPRDGIETAALMRDRYDVPIIYLTAHADEATLARAKTSGPYGYLMKPIKAAELRSAIEVSIHKHEMEKQLRDRERWLSTMFQSITDAVVTVDLAGSVTFMNAAAEDIVGVRAADASGHPMPDGTEGSWALYAADGVTPVPSHETPLARALSGEIVHQADMFVRSPGARDGRWHSISANPVRDRLGAICGAMMVSRDVTELRRAVEHLQRVAVRDELTGLLNRRGFQDHATLAIHLANRTSRPLALIYIDLNGMKTINDLLGHAAGDRALVETAELLRSTFRTSDVIARLGGDEFVVLAPEYLEDDDGAVVRARFGRHLAALHESDDRPFQLSASLGITIYDPTDRHCTIEELLAEADARMYVAKQRRRAEGTQRLLRCA